MVSLKDGRCHWHAVIKHGVLAKSFDTARYDRAFLRRVQKDVPDYFGGAVKPVRVVKCSAVDTVYCGKSLQVEVELCTAGRTKINGDPLAATAETCVKVAGLPAVKSNDVFAKIGSTMYADPVAL